MAIIQLTGEDGGLFHIDSDTIVAYGSSEESGNKRYYVLVRGNERVYCKEDSETARKLINGLTQDSL